MRKRIFPFLILFLLSAAPVVAQQQVRITIENLQPDNGFYFTPVWLAVHDGSFDYFDNGSVASVVLEALAEGGDVSGVNGDFIASGAGQSAVATAPAGFGGAPVFDPGDIASVDFTLASSERYLSFGSMIIPSNDSFFGNDSATAHQLLDAGGNYTGDLVLEFSLSDLWDAGTEVNDGQGAAFSTNGGMSTDENGVVNFAPDLSNLDGTGTAAGTTIDFASASSSPVLRITVNAIPEPATASVLGLVATGLFIRRRR